MNTFKIGAGITAQLFLTIGATFVFMHNPSTEAQAAVFALVFTIACVPVCDALLDAIRGGAR